MKNYVLGAVSIIVVLGIAGGAYLIGTKNNTPEKIQDTVNTPSIQPTANNQLPTSTPSPTQSGNSSSYVKQQIMAVINTMNTQPLEGYTADTVSVRLESSSCCGVITKSEAINQLSYLQTATGWDFDPTNPTIIALASASPQFYGAGWTVGVASNEYVFSFKLNSQNKMDAYNIAATYTLITP